MLALAALALSGGVCLTIGLARSEYETFTGYLQAQGRTITAGREARIAGLLVKQGEVARPGTPLLTLSDMQLEEARAAKQRQVAALEAELAQVHAQAAIETGGRRQKLEAEIFELKLKSAQFLKQQFTQQMETFGRGGALVESDEPAGTGVIQASMRPFARDPFGSGGTFDRQRSDAARSAMQVSTAQIELCNERLAELERRLENLPEQILEALGANVVQTRLDQTKAELARLDEQQQSLTLTAAVHGTVGVFLREAGDRVDANEPIVELLDEDQPYLLLQVPSARLADFTPGTMLDLRFPGDVKGEGRVDVIPPQVAPLPRPNERLAENASLLTVHISPAGRVWPTIPFGSTVEVRYTKRRAQ
jgi:multidrug resistance efflux pump